MNNASGKLQKQTAKSNCKSRLPKATAKATANAGFFASLRMTTEKYRMTTEEQSRMTTGEEYGKATRRTITVAMEGCSGGFIEDRRSLGWEKKEVRAAHECPP
jgi:hypothetical protein